ncbi:MAG: hypothetical protein L6R37_000158 [Teloschistes peruensis]|nr:MAG: hypothetical protein L6R37_000158 [Teloschistes peruensis]
MSPKVPIRFLDAGLGTTLELPPHNAKFREASSLWSSDFLISSPDTLSRVHKAFVDAGADVILTATYQASLQGFAATKKLSGDQAASPTKQHPGVLREGSPASKNTYGPEEAAALMRTAVPLAKEALLSRQHGAESTSKGVALSLGAYGATMQPSTEYSGEYQPQPMQTAQGLADWHAERFRIFQNDQATWKDVDYVSFETLPVLQEVQAVRQVMAKHNHFHDLRQWWISCVFPNDDLTLPDGSSVSAVVETMLHESDSGQWQRPWGIGINCTDIKKLNHLILQYEINVARVLGSDAERNVWPWLVTYPDGAQGAVYNTETHTWGIDPEMKAKGPQRPWHEELADIITKTAERGQWQGILVGGCCKTTPDDIKTLRAQLASNAHGAYYLETG